MGCGCGKGASATAQTGTGRFTVTIGGVERSFMTRMEAEAAARGAGLDPVNAVKAPAPA